MNVLIADCGSTKCDWSLIDPSYKSIRKSFQTDGLNLAIASPEIVKSFIEDLPQMHVGRVEFYGAGAKINPQNDEVLKATFNRIFRCTDVLVETDLVGAAKALFGNEEGIACILGTGSNSGVYNGEAIVANTPPLGYILGDEGSGAALGKRLVNAVFKGLLPADLTEKFFATYPITKQQLIERVYRQPGGNFFLAQFSKFLSANIERSEIRNIVEEEFRNFFTHNLLPYSGNQSNQSNQSYQNDQLTVAGKSTGGENPALGFVGSIAYHFGDVLRGIASEFYPDLDPESIIILPSPILGFAKNCDRT